MSVPKHLRKCFLLIDIVILFSLFYLMMNIGSCFKKKNISKTSQIIVNIVQILMEEKANTDEYVFLEVSPKIFQHLIE